jgi:hypothetical protein
MPATDTTRPAERLLGDLDAALAEVCRLAEELPRQTDQIRQLFRNGNGDVLRLVLPDDPTPGSAFPALALSKALADFPEQVETVAGVVEALVEQLHTATSAYREIATRTPRRRRDRRRSGGATLPVVRLRPQCLRRRRRGEVRALRRDRSKPTMAPEGATARESDVRAIR